MPFFNVEYLFSESAENNSVRFFVDTLYHVIGNIYTVIVHIPFTCFCCDRQILASKKGSEAIQFIIAYVCQHLQVILPLKS